jgi:hypothetical protein
MFPLENWWRMRGDQRIRKNIFSTNLFFLQHIKNGAGRFPDHAREGGIFLLPVLQGIELEDLPVRPVKDQQLAVCY